MIGKIDKLFGKDLMKLDSVTLPHPVPGVTKPWSRGLSSVVQMFVR